ncbi:hypothetical protein AUJ40_02730 [Candidatus Berkelbacteria bacterium CG1_02_42_45]|uniref:bAvd-like domain-containing protein n=1 Tax=Candidatus Berkelbacteria bacterium CG1_02_42_45 TaxID=1805036 RepID=A0A1J4RRQ1_9BACT|nr:MAG: hypothetical protein AUJ40_02730 [Candidatus Berkelbacteria bacterium CG1_02_42_45]
MSRYDHLKIYKSVYELILYFYKLSRGFTREFKFGLGQEIRSLLTDLLDRVVIANNSSNQEKIIVLSNTEVLIEKIKLKGRLLKDMNAIKIKSYEYFSRQLIESSKQISAWKKWAEASRC